MFIQMLLSIISSFLSNGAFLSWYCVLDGVRAILKFYGRSVMVNIPKNVLREALSSFESQKWCLILRDGNGFVLLSVLFQFGNLPSGKACM